MYEFLITNPYTNIIYEQLYLTHLLVWLFPLILLLNDTWQNLYVIPMFSLHFAF